MSEHLTDSTNQKELLGEAEEARGLGLTNPKEAGAGIPLIQNCNRKKIAIVGGGPAALFVYKDIVQQARPEFSVTIFEAGDRLGPGMPYSDAGANPEHVTNISSIEVPELVSTVSSWLRTLPTARLEEFGLDEKDLSKYKVLPRLLFGQYLAAQFEVLLGRGQSSGLETEVRLGARIVDVRDDPNKSQVCLIADDHREFNADIVILCTGHCWPRTHEGTVPEYFDSPYPPNKLLGKRNHPIALKGSSLTAIDAIRTLARNHGKFVRDPSGVRYLPDEGSEGFKIVMHSREGFLPAIRFHLDDPQLSRDSLLSHSEIQDHRSQNEGFVSLDYLFEKDFKERFASKEPEFYDAIKNMGIEDFVDLMMRERERTDPFDYFKAEYREASESIRNRESICWKEKLTVLSIAMNYPAKYFSAEDRIRLQETLMPLISLVIASAPQSSCEEVLALHSCDLLALVSLGHDSHVKVRPEGGIAYHYGKEADKNGVQHFETFIDCTGQPHLPYEDFPLETLKETGTVSPARLRFRSQEVAQNLLEQGSDKVEFDGDGGYYLRVPGVSITDDFQVIGQDGFANERIYLMAVPLMGGFNPDYSGLDFCEEASERVVAAMCERCARLEECRRVLSS